MVHHIRPLLCARIQRLKDRIFSSGMIPLALNSTAAQGGYACDHRIGCVGRASDVLQGEDVKAILKTNIMNHTVQRHDALRAFKGQYFHLIFHGGGRMYMIWTHLRFYNRHLANTMWYLQFHLLGQIKELHGIQNDIRFSKGVVYNAEKVEIHFLSSVSSVNSYVSLLKKEAGTLFFRGHANPNYILRPSIMRTPRLLQNESKIYHELIINCPDDFEKCHTHLEKLVKMQHYGLPTRLLDITRNPLVALYFACESNPESYGELVLISPENHEIKYPQSDTVSILASLPVFSYEQQQEFGRLASDPTVSQHDFNKKVDRLLHEVRLEKPAFLSEIKKDDLVSSFIVYALKNNDRIVKQDGAFILCGLPDGERSLEEFRYRENGKKVVILIDGKKKLLEQLETFSINRAALFPEIECVAEYLRNKYTS